MTGVKEDNTVHILAINGSPRHKNNTEKILKEALTGAHSVPGVTSEIFEFKGRKFEGCKGDCIRYCMREGKCCIDDDLNEFLERWLEADGIIFGSPVYHMGPPGQVKAALDRLGNVLFAYLRGKFPRMNKVCGVIVQGSSRWGGQEITIQFFIQSFLTMNCIPITGDMPQSYLGVAGYAQTWSPDSILEDKLALDSARNLGRRIAETTKIVQAGIQAIKDELPDLYFCKRILEERSKIEIPIDIEWQKKKSERE